MTEINPKNPRNAGRKPCPVVECKRRILKALTESDRALTISYLRQATSLSKKRIRETLAELAEEKKIRQIPKDVWYILNNDGDKKE